MRLTGMYEHDTQHNEPPASAFFIITGNDYELNFGGGGGGGETHKTRVNL